jgi:hypothetical protein
MDAADFEVCLLVDVSGSMGRFIGRLGEAIWAMRHAVDDLDGRMTVIAFESGPHQILAKPGDARPDERMFVPRATGGTEPTTALQEAWRVLGESNASNVMLCILTDGAWYTNDGDRIVEAMRALGIITVHAQMGRFGGFGQHGCEFGGNIDDPYALARLFRATAAKRIESYL